jgi:hypothetical protein
MSKVTIRTTYPIKNWERAPMPGQYVLIKFNNKIGIISHLISEAPVLLSRPGGNTYKVIMVEPLPDGRYLDYDIEVFSMKPIDYTESESFLEYLKEKHPDVYNARRKYIVNTRHSVAEVIDGFGHKIATAPGAPYANTIRAFLGVQPSKEQISSYYAKIDAENASKTESKGGRRKRHRSRKAKSPGRRLSRHKRA